MQILTLLLTAAISSSQQPAAPSELRYTVLMAGNEAGFETIERVGMNEWRIHYEFNDRGRGPKLDETLRTDSKAVPVFVDCTGNDYLKAPVTEHFAIDQGAATWKNRMESGETKLAASAFYVSISDIPQEASLVRALLQNGGRIALLPEGDASLERRGELELALGAEKCKVAQYAISGLGFTPTVVWVDSTGELFARIDGLFSAVIRKGWEAKLDELEKAQARVESEHLSVLAKRLGRRPTLPLLILHARLFDAETATARPNQTVVLDGNTIKAVNDDGKIATPTSAEVIDATGKTLLPGLWDMHVHLAASDGLLNLACGVTSVRDLANDTDFLLDLRRKYDDGTEAGPRISMAGFIDGRGPYQGPTKVFADDEKEARAAVERYAKLGYAQIKVYSSLKPELVPAIVQCAHAHQMRVSGHVPAFMTAEQFVRAGADEIQHANFLFLNFLFDKVPDTRTPARFTAIAEEAAGLDLDSERVNSFVKLLADRHTVIDPTLGIFEGMFVSRAGKLAPGYDSIADRLPAQVRRSLFYGGLEVPEGKDQRYRDSFRQMERMVKKLFDAGVPIVAGTDSLAGFALHRELELYVEAGIPPAKVLQLATLGAARVMNSDPDLGSIVPGKFADLLLVNGDPTTNISDVRKVDTVIKDGVIYTADALDRAIGVKPANEMPRGR